MLFPTMVTIRSRFHTPSRQPGPEGGEVKKRADWRPHFGSRAKPMAICCMLFWGLQWAAGVELAGPIRNGGEVIFPIPGLAGLRQENTDLTAVFTLRGPAGERQIDVDLADRALSSPVAIDLAGFPGCSHASVIVRGAGGRIVLQIEADPLPVLPALPKPAPGPPAAIEPGSRTPAAELPVITLPDVGQLRQEALGKADRVVTAADITYPVVADSDLPALASNNGVIVSRQSFDPADATKASLYFSYRKGIFDSATATLKGYRKMLVEVPLEREWLNGREDRTIDLPVDGFAIHTTEEREIDGQRWDNAKGYLMLGESSTGLFQGGQTADTDELGRIYITNVADGSGMVRFNPHTGRFEQPPVNLTSECRKLIPAVDGRKRHWDTDLAQVVCARGRVYLVFDRNYIVNTPNGVFETCSGVISVPQDHWEDAETFRADVRLHAASWPAAQHPLYDSEVSPDLARRAGGPVETTQGIAFGTWRLDLDPAGNTVRLATIAGLSDLTPTDGSVLPSAAQVFHNGLPKQRLINVGAAGRPFLRFQYGEFEMSRAALSLTLPGASREQLVDDKGRHRSDYDGAPAGRLTVRFDVASKIRSEPERYGTLVGSLSGVAQGPNYAVVPLADEPGQALGVCEYSYFVSKLDFSRRAGEGKVFRRYVPLLSNGRASGLPVGVGLGPYNATWIEHGGARWLYFTGYTGISRLKYAEGGRTLPAYTMESIHTRLSPEPVDGTPRDGVKDYLHILPAPGGRLLDIGRGRPGRGGGAHSAGLELFDPVSLGGSRTAVAMNRCYGLYTPVSRTVLSAAGRAVTQQVFAASGNIRPEYVEDIADPARRPANRDPKIFAYECLADGTLRDRFGFSLPVGAGDGSANIAFSPCRQYLAILQMNGTLLSYRVADQVFVDGMALAGAKPVAFARPTATIWTAPDGRLFFQHRADASRLEFHEIVVSIEGKLSVRPHLTIIARDEKEAGSFEGVVRCFLPDLANRDGSHDFVIGGDTENGGQPNVRVIDDFLPPAKR